MSISWLKTTIFLCRSTWDHFWVSLQLDSQDCQVGLLIIHDFTWLGWALHLFVPFKSPPKTNQTPWTSRGSPRFARNFPNIPLGLRFWEILRHDPGVHSGKLNSYHFCNAWWMTLPPAHPSTQLLLFVQNMATLSALCPFPRCHGFKSHVNNRPWGRLVEALLASLQSSHPSLGTSLMRPQDINNLIMRCFFGSFPYETTENSYPQKRKLPTKKNGGVADFTLAIGSWSKKDKVGIKYSSFCFSLFPLLGVLWGISWE